MMTRQKTDKCETPKLKKTGNVTKKFRLLIRLASCRSKKEEAESVEAKYLDEEAEEEPYTKRRRIREKKVDPFGIPPSGCTAIVFRIQQPFVNVSFSMNVYMKEGDVVCDGRSMNVEALKYAISVMSKEYVLACMTTRAPGSELACRDLHVALIKGFWWLTRPRRKCELDPQLYGTPKECKSEEKPSGIGESSGLDIEVDAHVTTELKDRISNDSLDVRLEGDEREGEENPKKQMRFDIKCQVYDEHLDGEDKSVTALLVECKWGPISLEDIFQAATYACEAMKKNLEKGYAKPLLLEVWNEMYWRYAVLYPMGLIELQAQSIVNIKGSSTSKESLIKELDNRKKNENYPGLEYPNGQYLQGVLFVSNERFTLPNTEARGSLLSGGSRQFYQSKLRILVGDKVLDWTVDDVRRAVEVREKAFGEKHAMFLDG